MEVWRGVFVKQNRTFDDYIANYKMEDPFFNLERDLLTEKSRMSFSESSGKNPLFLAQ